MKKERTRKLAIIAVLLAVAASAALFLTEKPPITGYATVATQLYVSETGFPYNCNLTLLSGWNLISIPCRAEDMSVDSLLENISGNYESIHGYDSGDAEDPWKSYKEGLPAWVQQDLQDIETTSGYWIRIINATSLNVSGQIFLPTGNELAAGWNLVGYGTNKSTPPQDSFSGINGSIASVHAYNASDSSDHWKVWAPSLGEAFNDLKFMVTYWGYWINATQPNSWIIIE